MLTPLLIMLFIGILGVLTHRNSRLENKILKNVPLIDWLIFIAVPIFFYISWVMLVQNILARPKLRYIPLDDFDILAITILFIAYGFAGNALHFVSKVLWRYLVKQKYTTAYRVNEMFHGKFSHYLSFLNAFLILFMLPVLEVNHPVEGSLITHYLFLISFIGFTFGIAAGRSILVTNEWFGGYNKPLFFLVGVLLTLITALFKSYGLDLSYYPMTLVIISVYSGYMLTFILRQIMIFSRLNKKRRLQFLAKILSA